MVRIIRPEKPAKPAPIVNALVPAPSLTTISRGIRSSEVPFRLKGDHNEA
jgi:hypothetical protein